MADFRRDVHAQANIPGGPGLPGDQALINCRPGRLCIADYFTRSHRKSLLQTMSGHGSEPHPYDSIELLAGIAKVHGYTAVATAPRRAQLTIAASDVKGECLPLIRIQYQQESPESGFWRIDGVQLDPSAKTCDANRVVDSF